MRPHRRGAPGSFLSARKQPRRAFVNGGASPSPDRRARRDPASALGSRDDARKACKTKQVQAILHKGSQTGLSAHPCSILREPTQIGGGSPRREPVGLPPSRLVGDNKGVSHGRMAFSLAQPLAKKQDVLERALARCRRPLRLSASLSRDWARPSRARGARSRAPVRNRRRGRRSRPHVRALSRTSRPGRRRAVRW